MIIRYFFIKSTLAYQFCFFDKIVVQYSVRCILWYSNWGKQICSYLPFGQSYFTKTNSYFQIRRILLKQICCITKQLYLNLSTTKYDYKETGDIDKVFTLTLSQYAGRGMFFLFFALSYLFSFVFPFVMEKDRKTNVSYGESVTYI